MARITGRRVPMSLPRIWMDDLMIASRGRPIISFERRCDVSPLLEARGTLRVSWSLMLAKAFGMVSLRRPVLRRAYVAWPWPHYFESDSPIASIALEREYEGEPAVFFGMVSEPHSRPLLQLQAMLERWKTAPVDSIRTFRRMIRYTRLPRPMRRLQWWIGVTASGRHRARNCGTFGISTTAGTGAVATNLISPVSSSISIGPLDDAGTMDIRLHFDHRAYDGVTAAAVLADLEATLNGPIADELREIDASAKQRTSLRYDRLGTPPVPATIRS
jgi:hypothetical protein